MFIIALAAAQAQAQDVAITEFINDSFGPEPAAEWVELYNYGNGDVDLSDWAIGDEDNDFSLIPQGTIIPAGGYLILANDPIQFVTDWGVGQPGVNVIQVTMTIANGADELVLSTPNQIVAWSLAWINDESIGYTTWLTDAGLNVSTHGDKITPGVVRAGDDNGIVGYLGYEDGAATSDPFAIQALNGDVGSPLAGIYGAPPPVGPTVRVGGVCPGVIDIASVDLTPGGNYALLTASGPGNGIVPGGPCAGLASGLNANSLTFRGVYSANAQGDGSITPNVPAGACGAAVQVLDVATCQFSNVA
jgi:hypothetical protein